MGKKKKLDERVKRNQKYWMKKTSKYSEWDWSCFVQSQYDYLEYMYNYYSNCEGVTVQETQDRNAEEIKHAMYLLQKVLDEVNAGREYNCVSNQVHFFEYYAYLSRHMFSWWD